MAIADEKYPRIAGVNYESMVDGEGVRAVIFLSGCSNNCPGCQNWKAQDPEFGAVCTDELIHEIAEDIKARPFLSGITLSGGDPMFDPVKTSNFIDALDREIGEELDLWIYTGYSMRHLDMSMDCLEYDDDCYLMGSPEDIGIYELMCRASHVVDGIFARELADKTLAFRGSSNQRIWFHASNGHSVGCHPGCPSYEDVTNEYDRKVKA